MMRHAFAVLACTFPLVAAARAAPETVYFMSADGVTEIVGYLFHPAGAGPHPAIVLLHGRAGPYSSNDNATCTLVARGVTSPCSAATLSKRHMMWGEFWASRGLLALLPDSFGPRGKAHGFGRFTHDHPDRESVNELTVRPLDAEGALAWLAGRRDIVPDRIFLQGWSNGGSTTLNGRTVFSLTSSRSRTPWLKREDERKGPVNWLKPRTAAYFLKPPGSVLTPPRHPPPDTLSSGSVAALRTGPACGRRWHRNWRRHWHSIGR